MSGNSPARVRERVRQWISEEGNTVTLVDDPQCRFNLEVANQVGLRFNVFQPNVSRDGVLVIGKIEVDQATRQNLSGLDSSERNEFLWDLKFDLLKSHFTFNMQPNGENPQFIIIQEVVYLDDLTKGKLIGALQHVNDGMLLVLWYLARRFGGTATSPQSSVYR